jgi:hypothetical protein
MGVRPALQLMLCALAVAGPACGRARRSHGPNPLLTSAAPAAKPDPARAATDGDVLVATLERSAAGAGLPALRLAGTAQVVMREGGAELERLDEDTLIERDDKGQFHARYHNSQDYGREVWFAGGTLWIRPGVGKYHRRAPVLAEEPARLFDETWGTLAAQLELCAAALAPSDGGETQVAGRRARRVTLALGKARKRPPETLPQRAWRDTITVTSLSGELAIDAETGVLLQGKLAATIQYVRDGHSYEMQLASTHAVSDLGAAVTITPPGDADSVDTPARSHEFEERDELLHGIAPPGKRAAAPPSAPGPAPAAPVKGGKQP